MNIPNDLMYTNDHEWAKFEDSIVTIGITDFAQGELGDIIFVELPEVGQIVEKDEAFGTIEAVKTVTDLLAPFSGKIIEINDVIEDSPEFVNEDCYGKGWFVKIEIANLSEKDKLLSVEDYQAIIN
ncbi:MAG: glycine cleavage system protein GcvH [Candidatus Marinimicrobia bacterium]|jgi:glycine cleavage system H protein|nr:glycine cleavage system protein GcvH [Candidatus Neomarinimicrobiota bacterium]